MKAIFRNGIDKIVVLYHEGTDRKRVTDKEELESCPEKRFNRNHGAQVPGRIGGQELENYWRRETRGIGRVNRIERAQGKRVD